MLIDFGWLYAEWDWTANGGLNPEDIPAGSGLDYGWVCPDNPNHRWRAQVRSRTIRGTGCPYCTHRLVHPTEALSTTHPDIAAEWHPTKNGDKTPADFTYGSGFYAWWQCPNAASHVYRARISSRTSTFSACPQPGCVRKRRGKPAPSPTAPDATPPSGVPSG